MRIARLLTAPDDPTDWWIHWAEDVLAELTNLSHEESTLELRKAQLASVEDNAFAEWMKQTVAVYLPAEFTLSSRINVDPKQQRPLIQSARYELEPWMGQDIETVHVACQPIGLTALDLTGIDHDLLTLLLKELARVGVYPDVVSTDAAILAMSSDQPLDQEDESDDENKDAQHDSPHALYCWIDPRRTLVYQPSGEVAHTQAPVIAATATEHMSDWLTQYMRHAHTNQVIEHSLPIFVLNGTGDNDSTLVQTLKREARHVACITPQQLQERWFKQALRHAITAEGPSERFGMVNLRQGDFQRQSAWQRWHRWSPLWLSAAASLLLIWACQQFLVHQAMIEAETVRQQQHALYRDWYPNAINVFDPPKQLRSKLVEQPAVEHSPIDTLYDYAIFKRALANVSSKFSASQRVELRRVRMDAKDGDLMIQLLVPSVTTLEQLKSELIQQSLAVEIHSAEETDDGSLAQLVVQRDTKDIAER